MLDESSFSFFFFFFSMFSIMVMTVVWENYQKNVIFIISSEMFMQCTFSNLQKPGTSTDLKQCQCAHIINCLYSECLLLFLVFFFLSFFFLFFFFFSCESWMHCFISVPLGIYHFEIVSNLWNCICVCKWCRSHLNLWILLCVYFTESWQFLVAFILDAEPLLWRKLNHMLMKSKDIKG